MAKSKYARYVIDRDLMPPQPPEMVKAMADQARAGRTLDRTMLLGVQDSILKGAFFAGCEILWGLTGNGPVDIELEHEHAFDEIIGFAGTNRNYPRELGGEIEFNMGGEKLTLTRTCLVFIPKGTLHCPITLKKIDTPIFMFEAGNDTAYVKKFRGPQ
jgi:hypothetical protein